MILKEIDESCWLAKEEEITDISSIYEIIFYTFKKWLNKGGKETAKCSLSLFFSGKMLNTYDKFSSLFFISFVELYLDKIIVLIDIFKLFFVKCRVDVTIKTW